MYSLFFPTVLLALILCRFKKEEDNIPLNPEMWLWNWMEERLTLQNTENVWFSKYQLMYPQLEKQYIEYKPSPIRVNTLKDDIYVLTVPFLCWAGYILIPLTLIVPNITKF